MRELAVDLTKQGHRVFPLLANSKAPAVDGGFHQASCDPSRVFRFWSEALTGDPLTYNMGIATGEGLIVVDIDIRSGKDGAETWKGLERQHGPAPRTFTVKTPGGGAHFYFKDQGRRWLTSSAGMLGTGVDVRGEGGYVVAPGSIIEGKAYTVLVDTEIAPIPEWLANRIEAPKAVKKAAAIEALDDDALEIAKSRAGDWLKNHAELSIEGNGGNATAYRVAAKVMDIGLPPDDALDLMLDSDWNESCEPPWNADELRVIVTNAATYRQNPIGSSSADVEFEDVSAEVAQAEAQSKTAQDAEWPQPGDPWEDVIKNRTPPDLSEDFLPLAFQAWADDEAERKGVSRGASSSLALGMLAASISARSRVQVKQNDTGFKNRPIMWIMTVGGPGSGKSPIQSAIMEPLKKIERERHLQYKQKMQVYTAALKAGKAKSTPDAEDPIKPRDRRRILNDATAEAVVIRESQSEHGATIVLDELDGFFGSFDAYRGGKSSKDAPFYLSAKNGDSWDVARVSREAVGTDLHAVNIIGGIQPSVIRKTAAGLGGNGMMQRFVICNMGQSREAPDRAPDQRLSDIVDAAVQRLSYLEPDRDAPIFKMHPEADVCRKRVVAFVRANINREDLPAGLSGWIDKLEGEWARIALILHLAEWASSSDALFDDAPLVISPETAHRAERFLLSYQWEQQRFFYEHVIGGLGAYSEAPRKAAGYILTNELREISNRDLQQKALRSVEDATERAAAMVTLGRAGWVRPISLKDGKPIRWAVNPAVHDIFTARAMGEAARRFTARKAIIEAGAERSAAGAA